MTRWQRYAGELVEVLTQQGVLTAQWRDAFAQVPRHVFVPVFYDADHKPVTAEDPAWLPAVYADESLITQLRPVPGTGLMWPTSSSTRPSLMAYMLDLLDVCDGHRVLEIGTGTGYQAALLCHRLGDQQATSIDIDAALVEDARRRLRGLGYRPHLTAGDGAGGVPERAPFDRIIATAGVPSIPPAWITQVDAGGLIVADLRGELASTLIVAAKHAADAVRGRFLPTSGHFMWLRAAVDNPLRRGGGLATVFDFTDPRQDTTDMPPTAFTDPDFRFVLQLMVPRLGPIGGTLPDGGEGLFLIGEDDASWIQYRRTGTGSATVSSGGPRLLWPAIVDAWHRWSTWGRPEAHRFGLTAYDDGRWHIWLDSDTRVVHTGS